MGHGLSMWNEMLGDHRKGEWQEREEGYAAFRAAVKERVAGVSDGKGLDALGRVWGKLRGGFRHAGNLVSHAKDIHYVDHSLGRMSEPLLQHPAHHPKLARAFVQN